MHHLKLSSPTIDSTTDMLLGSGDVKDSGGEDSLDFFNSSSEFQNISSSSDFKSECLDINKMVSSFDPRDSGICDMYDFPMSPDSEYHNVPDLSKSFVHDLSTENNVYDFGSEVNSEKDCKNHSFASISDLISNVQKTNIQICSQDSTVPLLEMSRENQNVVRFISPAKKEVVRNSNDTSKC